MKRLMFCLTLVLAVALASPAFADQPPQSGQHYNLNIIGFANCTMTTPGAYPDCFNGNQGPGGHVIFVPLKTAQVENVCQTDDISDPDGDGLVTVADLMKGVRILVTDGPDLEVLDKDATDGSARFQLPDGCYEIFASAGGKPGGCADVDTIICQNSTTFVQEDCNPNLLAGGQQYVLVGHINVDRPSTGGKPRWDNVTNQLLGAGGYLVSTDGYFDFFWQIYNQNLRVLHLRIKEVACE